jgi:maltose-binding protein MalE
MLCFFFYLKLQSGEITDASFDVIVCTPETLQDVNAIKKKINKDRLPSLKSSKFYFDFLKRFIILFILETVGANIFELVSFHRLSKTYESNKIEEETSTLKANIGFVMIIHLFSFIKNNLFFSFSYQ